MGKRKSVQQSNQKKGNEETIKIELEDREDEVAEEKIFEFEYDPSAAGRNPKSEKKEDEQLEKLTDAIVIAFFIALVIKVGHYIYTNYYLPPDQTLLASAPL